MEIEEIVVNHSFRERNSVAHLLAKEAFKQPSFNKLCSFVLPPEPVIDAYHNREGHVRLRKVSTFVCCNLAVLGNDNVLRGISTAHQGTCNDGSLLPPVL